MTIGDAILRWMDEHDRTLAHVARNSGLDVGEIIALVCGHSQSSELELQCLAEALELDAGELQPGEDDRPVADPHPLQCYTVREVAHLLGVSQDTVRAEMRSGALRYVVVGERAHRIPHTALAWRLTW